MEDLICISPVDGREYARRALTSSAQVDRAIDQARKAQREWAHVPLSERCRIVGGFIEAMQELNPDIVPELAAKPGEIVLDKPGKGAFHGTPLTAILAERKITHLVFSGVTTEVCVQTTMREANDRGYDCLLIEDATESYFPEFKRATLEMIRAQGAIVGWTAPFAALSGAGGVRIDRSSPDARGAR